MKLRQGYIKDGIGYIPLTQGKWALVDAHNFHWLSQFNWYAHLAKNGRWYAGREARLGKGRKSRMVQYMARVIMGVTNPKIQIDHKDRENTLDNREENLRVATGSQNACNRVRRKDKTSPLKGVSWYKSRHKWLSQIAVNHASINLGYFNTAVEAAAVYNFAAKRLHGAFAVLNDLSQVTEAQLAV